MALSLADLHFSGASVSSEIEAQLEREDREHDRDSELAASRGEQDGSSSNNNNNNNDFQFYDPRGLFSKQSRRRASVAPKTGPGETNAGLDSAGAGSSKPSSSSPTERGSANLPPSSRSACLSAHEERGDADDSSLSASVISLDSNSAASLTASPQSMARSVPILIGKPSSLSPSSAIHGDRLTPSRYRDGSTANLSQPVWPQKPDEYDVDDLSMVSRSMSRSRSNSPLGIRTSSADLSRSYMQEEDEDEEMDGGADGSTILSPAAEFLGSFTGSGTMLSGRNRSGTTGSRGSRRQNNISNTTAESSSGFQSQMMSANASQTALQDIMSATATKERQLSQSSFGWNRSFIAPDPDEEGEQVDGYILGRLIGQGTFSIVREARNIETDETVAVKIVRHAQFRNQEHLAPQGLWARPHASSFNGPPAASTSQGRASVAPTNVTSIQDSSAVGRDRTMSTSAVVERHLPPRSPETAHQSKPNPKLGIGSPSANDAPDKMSQKQHLDRPIDFSRSRSCSSPSISRDFLGDLNSAIPASIDQLMSPFVETQTQVDNEPTQLDSAPLSSVATSTETETATPNHFEEELSKADPALQKEIYIWSQLDSHDNIVPLIDFVETDFASFIFMPLCSGNLLEYVRDNGRGSLRSPMPPVQPAAGSGKAASQAGSSPPTPSVARSSSIRSATGRRDNERGANNSELSRSPQNLSLYRTTSITSNSSTASSGKPHRSGSIRLRHPGEVVSGGTGLPLRTVKKIFAQVVQGLRYLHTEAHVTHKDIKLENILMDKMSMEDSVNDLVNFRISDFGLAHASALLMAYDGATSPGSNSTTVAAANKQQQHQGGSSSVARVDGKNRREHALSDSQVSFSGRSIHNVGPQARSPTAPIAFPSLGEAASSLISPPLSGAVSNATATSPDEGMPIDSGFPAAQKPSAAVPILPPASRVVQSKPSLALRRISTHAVPTSLSSLATTFGEGTAGSLQYTSPEQIRSPAPVTDFSVDIWALGCVLYAMIEGKLPFDDGFEPRLRVSIMKGDWKLPGALKRGSHRLNLEGDADVQDEERERIETVLRGCLELEPQKRWTIEQVAASEWLRDVLEPDCDPMSPIRGRKRLDENPHNYRSTSRHVNSSVSRSSGSREAQAAAAGQVAGAANETGGRSRSRGRPAMLRRDSSRQGRSGSSTSSSRRGPSVDEYRRARGDRGSPPGQGGGRSRSAQRRYGGTSANTWEIV